MKDKLYVRDVMTHNVITISLDSSVLDSAKIMLKNDIGSVVVVDENNKPLGIVTERDFVDVVVSDETPSQKKVSEVMSAPLITTNPGMSIIDSAKLMNKSKTRKLPVMKNDSLVGIITAEDIVRVAPKEIELLLELASMKSQDSQEFLQSSSEGTCEACGNYTETLHQVGSSYMCLSCKETTEASEV